MSSDTKKAEETPTYSVERLVAEAGDFLGVPSHVAAGALSSGRKNLTREEAKAAVDDWLAQRVVPDNPLGHEAEAVAKAKGGRA